ncbi:MAG: YgcG family protein [Bacteroidales bacterium]
MVRIAAIIALCLLGLTASFAQEADVPFLTGRVNDEAQILAPETIRMLSDSLKAHEDLTTNQIVVLTVPSLNGESIEDYANRVFNSWKLGQADKDNGILIVVAPNDRRMRIEVGYGLEGTITDLLAGRIIRNIMTPRFKENDYNGGISDGALAVIAILKGEIPEGTGEEIEPAGESVRKGFLSDLGDSGLTLMERILLGAFIFGIIGLFTFLGVVTPGMGWFLYIFLIPFWASFPIVVLGLKGAFVLFVIYIIGFPVAKLLLKRTKWYIKAGQDLKSNGSASIGGFTFSSGGSGSSWSSGSSHSSGGFSGGGGSSGGGGASGGW